MTEPTDPAAEVEGMNDERDRLWALIRRRMPFAPDTADAIAGDVLDAGYRRLAAPPDLEALKDVFWMAYNEAERDVFSGRSAAKAGFQAVAAVLRGEK